MSISKNKTSILLNIDKELKEKIQIEAKKQGRSNTNLIIFIIENYFKEHTN